MKIKSFIKLYYPAVLILVAILSFTIYAYFEASTNYEVRTNRLFEQRSFRVAEVIGNRMTDYGQILRGCQALFDASENVAGKEWKTYVNGLNVEENYPGIQGLAVSKYLGIADSTKFLQELRKANRAYTITSTYDHEIIAPVLYIEPLNKRNERALAYDLYSEAHRRDAINRSIKTKQPSITRKIVLRQETQKNVQPGFLMFLPLFSDSEHTKVTGFVSSVFRTHDLMRLLLNRYSDVDVRIYDGNRLSREHLIYEKSLSASLDDVTGLASDTTIIVAGLPWRIIVNPNKNFGSAVERQQPYLIGAIGLVLSILLFLISYNNTRRKIRIAEELERSRALEKKKDEFISIASHELKTPLTSISSAVQILERADLKEKDRFLLTKAKRNINKLQSLISDLLDISKMQAGQLSLNKENFDLPDLIHESIESVSHMYNSHAIELLNSIPDISYYGDKFRLEQALNNLLMNAIKYSPQSKKVFVDVSLKDTRLKIKIIDEGIGISKQNQNKVFDRFFRAEELSPVISGLGIGLHISNEIVRRHNGSISLRSELNQGSVFTIELPYAK
ncbi:MAG TPA: CHASE domain-containing protein [Pedobacter sp.]|jgi:signal transduction histidine kinase